MPVARCSCGALTATVAAYSPAVVPCHCTACQRRSGAPFGGAAFFPADAVMIAGDARKWSRPTDAGRTLVNSFYPKCGATVFWTTPKHPGAHQVAWVDPPAAQHFVHGAS